MRTNSKTDRRAKGCDSAPRLVLHLPLTFEWFDLTERGEKSVEYRVMIPRWEKQIWERRDEITHVRFRRGFTQLTIEYPVEKIDVGPCPIPGWNDQYYRIHFKQNDEVRGASPHRNNNSEG
jgi:hypothetical protein